MSDETKIIEGITSQEYKYGFVTDIEQDSIPPGLDEDVVRLISEKKSEPDWLLEWRLKAFRHWTKLQAAGAEPTWAKVHYPPIDYQNIIYYSAPKSKPALDSLDEVDPKLLETYAKLGIPLEEQKQLAGVAVDAVFDSVSVATTFKETLAEAGVIFCPFSEAVQKYPELVRKYLGSVVPYTDNFFAALNSAVFSDGSFVFLPKGVRSPMELSACSWSAMARSSSEAAFTRLPGASRPTMLNSNISLYSWESRSRTWGIQARAPRTSGWKPGPITPTTVRISPPLPRS